MKIQRRANQSQENQIDMMLRLMEYRYLFLHEEKFIDSLKKYYEEKNYLSKKQYNSLKKIFDSAATRVEWSRSYKRY